MKSILLLSTFYLFVLSHSFAQSFFVDDIRFEGLKKTRHSYLKRFIDQQINTKLDAIQVVRDVQQLKNLLQVADAHYSTDTLDNRVQLTYHIDEALTFFPVVNFGGVQGNIWGQVGFTDINWLGLGHQLTAYYQNSDGRSGGNLFYRLPYIG
ncbi:MAG: POTRA domain-containing protein, partial [Bacteroidota bacterium]